jgi:hypothetical protein
LDEAGVEQGEIDRVGGFTMIMNMILEMFDWKDVEDKTASFPRLWRSEVL